ncbi:MAG: MFS transporter [Alphaproteobacteria bacterium]
MNSQFSLLRDRRFAPLFITQFLGAFNDNLMKTFVVIMIAYAIWDSKPFSPEVLVSLAASIFMLPFVLFCPLAGLMTDKFDKSLILRSTKIAEIFIVILCIITLYSQSTMLALLVLFALGTQSAFFSPGKFSILPQHLHKEELIGANGLISTGTYLAILAGSIYGTLIALKTFDTEIISVSMLACSIAGLIASRFIPPAPSDKPDIPLTYNPFITAADTLRIAYTSKAGLFWAILAVSWFYFVAATIHAQFPNFVKQTLNADTNILAIFMVVFSLGIAVGGLLNNRLLKSQISTRLVPYAAFAIAIFAADLFYAGGLFFAQNHNSALLTPAEFFHTVLGWRILADIFFLSLAGGLYIVPLRSVIQSLTPPENCARIMAANALTDSLFMLVSSIMATILLSIGLLVRDLFLVLALLTLCVGFALAKYKKF